MNNFASDDAACPAQTTGFAESNLGPFDPADTAAGDVLFLDAGTDVFAAARSMLGAPHQASQSAASREPARHPHQPQLAPWAIVPGLTASAILQTDKGEVAAADLCAGQRILTRDKGFQTVIWVGQRKVSAAEMTTHPALRPVLIAAGALGPNLPAQDMLVPQTYRLLVEGPRTKLMFAQREVFVEAAHLVGFPAISLLPAQDLSYVHILCNAHEVIWANGIWGESLHLEPRAFAGFSDVQNIEIRPLSAKIAAAGQHDDAARRTLLRNEADLLLA